MHFCDETSITVQSGHGGNGCIAFRRERYIARGGPNGGNGGEGGDVIIKTNHHLNTLIELHKKKFFQAQKGNQGSSYLKNGEAGEDLILEVPVGTIITDAQTQEVIADMNAPNMSIVIVAGGRGGYGNAHFKSSTRQAPRFAELGEPGKERALQLELKLVADIGIIGLPSAGKSTLISRISAAKPKIAEYHFTTLVPNLGVVELSAKRSLVVCDIPGLIAGAHEGKGLGDQFLRHISRSRVLVHLIDITGEDIAADYQTIRGELEKYSPELAQKKEIVALSKIDLLGKDEELLKMMRQDFCKKTGLHKKDVFTISAAANMHLSELLEKMWEIYDTEKKETAAEEPATTEHIVLKPHLEKDETSARVWEIFEEKDGFRVHGTRIEQIAIMTDLKNIEAVMRLRDVMKKVGIEKELLRLGATMEHKVHFGEQVLDFVPTMMKSR